MKHHLIFFIIASGHFALCMESNQTKAQIQKIVRDVFRRFDISANDNCSIDTETPYPNEPDENLRRWAGSSECVHLSQDIQNDPYLTEFAAHCIAASSKNNSLAKSLFIWGTAYCVSIIASTIPLCFVIDSIPGDGSARSASTFLILGKLLASLIPICFAATNGTYYTMISDSIANHFDSKSFTLACQKLIEKNNLKPLATYYAFAKLVKHRPLSQESQICTIKWVLQNSDLSITSSLTGTHSSRACIWKDGKCIISAQYCEPLPYKEANLASDNTSARIRTSWINA